MDMSEIQDEIKRLEKSATNYTNCGKLATLYTIRNEYESSKPDVRYSNDYSYASAPDSEFIKAFKSADTDNALKILDDHFNCIRILYPKEYNIVLSKLVNT